MSSFDEEHMVRALIGAIEIAFAAGATRILTAHSNPISLSKGEATSERLKQLAEEIRQRGIKPNSIALFSAHQMGTARMDVDPDRGVVDQFGRVHGVNGLVVCDSSVFPLASGVNPMLTIMALAHRSISQVSKEFVRDKSSNLQSVASA
jgi:choline dehydrogenase-like flavoprotein